MNNPVNWFEIPTNDLEKAKTFYSSVFKFEFQSVKIPGSEMYVFSGDLSEKGAMGAIVKSKHVKPTDHGTVVYFDCKDLTETLQLIENAGGTIIFPKTYIGFGNIAQFSDTEGNRLGLYAPNN